MNRSFNSHLNEYKRFCATEPKMAYDEGQSFPDWQNSAREKLAELLGLPFEICDPDFQIEYTNRKKTVQSIDLVFKPSRDIMFHVICLYPSVLRVRYR